MRETTEGDHGVVWGKALLRLGCAIGVIWPAMVATLDAMPKGDAVRGRGKTETCVACHQTDGNSLQSEWPKLAGQHPVYTFSQLQEFKKGEAGKRYSPVMQGMLATFTEQDLADLAVYFAMQTPTFGKANPAVVARGEKIYRGGSPSTQTPACMACHGPSGEGLSAAGFPRLAGQGHLYTQNELKAYKTGERSNGPNGMMSYVASTLSDGDIEAVSSYIEGLR